MGQKRGLDVNSGEFYYDLPKDVHRLKSGNGIHANSSSLEKNWNAIWKDYIDLYLNETKEDVLEQLAFMEKKTDIGQYRAVKK